MNNNELYAQRMGALLSLADPSIIKTEDYKAIKKINSSWGLRIDTGLQTTGWQLVSRGKLYDWKNGLGVPSDIIEQCTILEEKYLNACDQIAFSKVTTDADKPELSEPSKEAIRKREEDIQKLEMMENLRSQNSEREEPVDSRKKAEKYQSISDMKKNSVYDIMTSFTNHGIIQILGLTGAGKSKVSLKMTNEAIERGLKVLYVDSEENINDSDISSIKGADYHYIPAFDDIYNFFINPKRPLPHYDLVVLDSIGLPALSKYARVGLNQQGSVLLKMQAMGGFFKEWSHKNNALILVTNQFESDFNKDKDHRLRGFGDKFQYFPKETLEIVKIKYSPTLTESEIKVYQSRSKGAGYHIANIKITDNGLEVV